MADRKFCRKLQGNFMYLEYQDGLTAHEVAVKAGKEETATLLAKKMGSPLFIACIRGDVVKMKELIDSGVDVDAQNAYGETALHYAAAYGNMDALKVLMDARANPFIRSACGRILH